ncbi:TPA: LLM class flavin-dependent oxidoreductase [Klebsiella pneumoniae]
MPKRLGFFTRLLDQGSAQTRYRLAAEQIRHAERLGFDSAWIAQHHFHEQEGGLPSPLVFLAHVAAQTDRIRLGTAIITLPMDAIQNPIIDAYLSALPDGVAPRILASRTAFVADSHAHALQVAEPGLRKQATQHRAAGHTIEGDSVTDYLQQLDAHVGDPEHVIASLAQDSVLARATDISFQVHSVEPSHRDTLRSIELIAQHIAPHIR